MATPWLLWQLADSALPTGGFAHSNGLEAAHHLAEITDASSLATYVEQSIAQLAQATLPLVAAGHGALTDGDETAFIAIDAYQDSFLANHIANRASRALGRGVLSTMTAAFAPTYTALATLETLVRQKGLPCHQAPIWGALCAILQLERVDCLRLFLFQHLRGCMSSAVRLGIIGPRSAQALQHNLSTTCETWLQHALERDHREVRQCMPLFELFHAHHDRLYSRLFSS